MCNQNRGHDRSGIYVLHWNIWRTYCSSVDFLLRLVTTLAPVLPPTWLHPSRPYQPIPILGSWRDKGRYYSLEAAAVASLGSPVRTHFRLWWCRLTNHECTLCRAPCCWKQAAAGQVTVKGLPADVVSQLRVWSKNIVGRPDGTVT